MGVCPRTRTEVALCAPGPAAGPTACTSSDSEPGLSVDDLLKKIQDTPNVACDKPQWEFHGVTMAGLNAVWSFMLAGVIFMMIRKGKKDGNAAG